MNVRRSLLGLTFCTCYLASHLTNNFLLGGLGEALLVFSERRSSS